jgi:hypothetical protein
MREVWNGIDQGQEAKAQAAMPAPMPEVQSAPAAGVTTVSA